MKRLFIILGSVLLTFYVIFLALPLVLNPVIKSYNSQITDLIKQSVGYDSKIEDIKVVTTPKLTVGVKVRNFELAIPNDETFFKSENFKFKISLLPLLLGKIEADCISADSLIANFKVKKDGSFLIFDYLPSQDKKGNNNSLQKLPLGLKLSNRLPDIRLKNYDVSLTDMKSNKKYILDGANLAVTDFVLDKHIKIATNGEFEFDGKKQFVYDLKVLNRLMPDINLNDIVFAEQNNEAVDTQINQSAQTFNIIPIFDALRKLELQSDIYADLKISGTFAEPIIDGIADLEKISMLVDGAMLPESRVKISAKGHNINTDIMLNSAKGEKTTLNGKFKTGKNIKADMRFISNAQINNLINIIDNLAMAFGCKDFNTLSANGAINADFSLTTDMKTVNTDGYLKIPSANINYGLYNVKINDINADVDFKDKLNIKNISFNILNQPLKIYGTIEQNSQTDLHINADKLLLKGLVAAAGQVQILKENIFNSGTLTMDAGLKGKLRELVPSVNLSIYNVDIKNISSQTRITFPNAKFMLQNKKNAYSGLLNVDGVKIINPAISILLSDTAVLIDENDIDIQKCYLILNSSKIDIAGIIKNYINDKMAIDIKASGSLQAKDVLSLIPKEMHDFISVAGAVPLKVNVTGNAKAQDVKVLLSANPSNYVSILDIDSLKNHKTLINSDIHIANDTATLSNTGIFVDSISNSIVSLSGSVSNLSKSQNLNLRLSVPKTESMPVIGFSKKSNMSVRGDVDITGVLSNPHVKGLVNIPEVKIPEMDFVMTNTVANLNGAILKGNATVQKLAMGTIVAENISAELLLKDYSLLYLNNIMADAFAGKISGDISYNIANGKIGVKMQGSEMDAVKTIEGCAGIPNALSGTLAFDADVTTSGITDIELMKNLNGKASFDINNGKFLNVGRFDNLLYAQNIVGNALLKSAVTSVTNQPAVQNTAEFKNINGKFTFNNGIANLSPITASGTLMSYYITGTYNLVNFYTDLLILGRIDEKVVAVLGPIGMLSVNQLSSYIPKFGGSTALLINILTADPSKENTKNIPALSTGSEKYSDFRVEFAGKLDTKITPKSFKWLSNCDTSAIDYKQETKDAADSVKNKIEETKQQYKEDKESFKQSVQDVKNDYKETKESLKQSVQDTKQQLKDAKDSLKNMFKLQSEDIKQEEPQ